MTTALRTGLRFALGILPFFLLTACDRSPGMMPMVAAPDTVTLRLAEASERAANALDNIARVEQTRNPPPAANDFAGAPPNLVQPITLTWTGPIETIVKILSERIGYSYMTVGNRPPVPVVVTIDVYEKPLVAVLQDVGFQATNRVDLVLDGERQIIELRYAPSQG
jgi:defect in organelle trafficking protein DotD